MRKFIIVISLLIAFPSVLAQPKVISNLLNDKEKISTDKLMAEVMTTNLLIEKLTGKKNIYFRPPKGVLKPQDRHELNRKGS